MFPSAPLGGQNIERWLRLSSEVINGLLAGRSNNTGELTLTANAASTTLTDPRLNVFSVVLLDPVTSNAAAAIATTYATKANRNNGSWVFTHANNAQTDKTFRYAIVGGAGLGYST